MNLPAINIVLSVLFVTLMVIVNIFYRDLSNHQEAMKSSPIIIDQHETEEAKESQKKDSEPVFGTIQNLKMGTKSLGGDEVTVFEIKNQDGEIFYAGIEDAVDDLKNGYIGEFHISDKLTAYDSCSEKKINTDGSVEYTEKEMRYLEVTKYKIYGKTLE